MNKLISFSFALVVFVLLSMSALPIVSETIRSTSSKEIREYEAYRSGVKMGERKEIEEGWSTVNSAKVKKITVLGKTGQGEKAIYVNQTVYLNEKYLPIRTYVEVVSPTGKANSTTIFSGKTITLEVTQNNETRKYTIKAPKDTYEDGVLYTSLSSFPIKEGYTKTLSIFSSFLGIRFDAELKVTGRENIQIGNKKVECFVLEIETAHSEQPIIMYLRTSDLLFVKQSYGAQDTVIKPEFL